MVKAAASSHRSLYVPAVIIILIALIDQVTKLWAVSTLNPQDPVPVLGQFLQFTLVYNEGGAMGTNFGSTAYYLISSILILLFVLYYLYVNRHLNRVAIPLALIAGGAVGNIIDRVRLGRVVDFIDVDIFDVALFGYELNRWWTFNIADAAISVSIVYLIYSLIAHRGDHKEELPTVEEDQPPNGRTDSI